MNNKNFKFNVAFNLIKLINYSLETIEKKGGKKDLVKTINVLIDEAMLKHGNDKYIKELLLNYFLVNKKRSLYRIEIYINKHLAFEQSIQNNKEFANFLSNKAVEHIGRGIGETNIKSYVKKIS